MMIRNILILTVLAALVPTVMSNVSASAASEIALFSTASVDSDSLSIIGNEDSAKMGLKATNDDGKLNRIAGFQLTADNLLLIDKGDKVTVKDDVVFTKAITTDARNNQKVIGITSNGVIDFAGYNQGVYKLDVVVDDDKAYEVAIVVIGGQTQESVKSVNKEVTFEIYSGNYTGGGGNSTNGNRTGSGGSGNITSSGSSGGSNMTENSNFASSGGSNMTENSNFASSGGSNMTENSNFASSGGDGGSNMTQGVTEFATVSEEPGLITDVVCVPEETLVDGKCVPNPMNSEPEPEPICSEGEELIDGQCSPIATDAVEPILYEDPLPIGDENDDSDDQSIIGDDDLDESEDDGQEEESGSDDDLDESEDDRQEEESGIEGESEQVSEDE